MLILRTVYLQCSICILSSNQQHMVTTRTTTFSNLLNGVVRVVNMLHRYDFWRISLVFNQILDKHKQITCNIKSFFFSFQKIFSQKLLIELMDDTNQNFHKIERKMDYHLQCDSKAKEKIIKIVSCVFFVISHQKTTLENS